MSAPGTREYPTREEHAASWAALAEEIAARRDEVREVAAGEVLPGSRPGSLTVLGTGIESLGLSIGDERLIAGADRVLFCVADPATIVWIKQRRPDALDMYVLYGEDKPRYTTYMQMAEAQLHYVRKGLDVVVLFYGHPGIFVLSTHRAIMIARREGYRAVMRPAVSALDTLCADLAVDPAYPGMATYEATDALLRQRPLDPCLHVVLWQVGLIGEMGYRAAGFHNHHFAYFVAWLQRIYGDDYEIIHYIGAKYPTLDPVIARHRLSELLDVDVQATINGISTFYIPPRDVRHTDRKVARDLGLLKDGQTLVTPREPVREIGSYSAKEMRAFDAFATFRIPPSYHYQRETEAAKFLLALRMDPALQHRYRVDPIAAVSEPRFAALSDKERALLVSRDGGSVQIAAKGLHVRDVNAERTVAALLSSRAHAAAALRAIRRKARPEARADLVAHLSAHGLSGDIRSFRRSIDRVHRDHLYPWTGVYLDAAREIAVTIVGHSLHPARSVVYVNDRRVLAFHYAGGRLRWEGHGHDGLSGVLSAALHSDGTRRLSGRVWPSDGSAPAAANFYATECKPRTSSWAPSVEMRAADHLRDVEGEYVVRTTGALAGVLNSLVIDDSRVWFNGRAAHVESFQEGRLEWTGGNQEVSAGSVTFVREPITNLRELYGSSRSELSEAVTCYGSLVCSRENADAGMPGLPLWATLHLAAIVRANASSGGLLLWHRWEKHAFTNAVVNRHIARLL